LSTNDAPVSAASENVPFLSRATIEAKARDVLRHHDLTAVPIDPVVLANRLGIRINNAKFADETIVGMIAKRGDKITLLVNQSDPPFRKRYTIAHELGHHFLHLLSDGEYVDGEANLFRQDFNGDREMTPQRRKEIQANMFAAALLMPEDAVRQAWERLKFVDKMAQQFNVSEWAMGIRIDQLGLE
jgi:Zn-dependent peptidase ImmA (M78 family)